MGTFKNVDLSLLNSREELANLGEASDLVYRRDWMNVEHDQR